jgi:hypothetical protein
MNTNMTPRLARKSNRVSFQLVAQEGDSDFTTKNQSTFSITVKGDDDKVLYENKEEAFSYESVDSIQNALRYFGAELNDASVKFIGEALKGEESGKATKKLVDIVNSKLKADAKSNAYQALVNKYKPLEGEKKESAMARLVANFIKLAGVSKENAIDTLKAGKALPEDYTVADFDSTPLRRAKGESEE